MKYFAPIFSAFGLLGGVALATMSPANLQDTANSLARQAFDAKDLVLQISSTMNSGPMQVCLKPFPHFHKWPWLTLWGLLGCL